MRYLPLFLILVIFLPSVYGLNFDYKKQYSTIWCVANLDNNATAIKWDVGESSTTGWITDLEYGKYFTFTAPYAGTYKIILYERLENGSIRKFARIVNIVYSSLNRTNYTLPEEEEPFLNLPPQRFYQVKHVLVNITEEQFIFILLAIVLVVSSIILSVKKRRR